MNKVRAFGGIVYPLLSRITEATRIHERAVALAAWAQRKPERLARMAALGTVRGGVPRGQRLHVRAGGVDLANPLILPAGFDKDARGMATLHALGFASVVVGTVLPEPQRGNPPPTIFRPAPGVVLNRMGFPSAGVDAVRPNLAGGGGFPVGVSVGINRGTPHSEAPAAYAHVVRETHAHAAYFEINVSSPNTPGLRALQNRDHLRAIIGAIRAETSRPLWIKIAPDLTQPAIDEVIDVAVTHGIDAIAAVNTTNDPAVKAALGPRWVDEAGGVSGPPLRARATEVVAYIAAQGVVDVIGVGGVTDFESLLEKLQAGAKAVGIYTGFVTQGPALPSLLLHQLDAWLGERTLTQAFNH